MNQPDLFPSIGFSIAPGKRAFAPRPVQSGYKRVLIRCSKRDCKFCRAVDCLTVEQPSIFGAPLLMVSRDAKSAAMAGTTCPKHGQMWLTWNEVEGTTNESRKCDPRCTGAIGPDCSCQCGGANHGCDWL